MSQMECPFCTFIGKSEYEILYHLEDQHPEDSMGAINTLLDPGTRRSGTETPMTMNKEESKYAECPLNDCGESILLEEMGEHIDLHGVETESKQDFLDRIPQPQKQSDATLRSSSKVSERLKTSGEDRKQPLSKAGEAWRSILSMPKVRPTSPQRLRKYPEGRLGTTELGPHAYEDEMPSWLRVLLRGDGKPRLVNKIATGGKVQKAEVVENYSKDVIPVLRQLLEQDSGVDCAYLCHPAVQHIFKLKLEGGFCGYRNIQMLSSYMIAAEVPIYSILDGRIPSIFEIQDYIETAWDNGIHPEGRKQTGGVRGTRKFIGTPEAVAMLEFLGIPRCAHAFKGTSSVSAHAGLLEFALNYFSEYAQEAKSKVVQTWLPPIYLQHPGHSLTIVGVEVKKDGSRSLLVFDPMYHDPPCISKLIHKTFQFKDPGMPLKAYRRGPGYLRKYPAFEVLWLPAVSPTAIVKASDSAVKSP